PHVPASLRERDRPITDTRTPLLPRYSPIRFGTAEIHVDSTPQADLVHPALPLIAALTDPPLDGGRRPPEQGAVPLDPADMGELPSLLLLVDHSVREGSSDSGRVISRRLQFVRTDGQGTLRFAGWAPHLDLEPLDAGELARVKPILEQSWLASGVE